MTRKALLLIYIFSTNSIAGMWYHDTANEAQFNIDSAQCQLEAQQVVQAPRQYVPPPQAYNQQVPPSYNTQCRMIFNTLHCDSNPSGGQELNRILQERERQQYELGRNIGDAIGRNLQMRNYVETCLKARGYVWK